MRTIHQQDHYFSIMVKHMDTPSFVKDCMQKTTVCKYTKRMFHNYLPYNIIRKHWHNVISYYNYPNQM